MQMKLSSVLSRVLAVLYLVAGGTKIFPVSPQAKDAQLRDFVQFAKVFPLAQVGYRPEAAFYMRGVGVVEVGLGLTLLLGGRRVRMLACAGLVVVMVGAAHTLYLLKRYTEVPIPCSFLAGLLFTFYKLAQDGHSPPRPSEEPVSKRD